MLRTNMLHVFVIQQSFHHFNFVIHTQNCMVPEGLLSMIICNNIQNQNMAYDQCTKQPMNVLNVCLH